MYDIISIKHTAWPKSMSVQDRMDLQVNEKVVLMANGHKVESKLLAKGSQEDMRIKLKRLEQHLDDFPQFNTNTSLTSISFLDKSKTAKFCDKSYDSSDASENEVDKMQKFVNMNVTSNIAIQQINSNTTLAKSVLSTVASSGVFSVVSTPEVTNTATLPKMSAKHLYFQQEAAFNNLVSQPQHLLASGTELPATCSHAPTQLIEMSVEPEIVSHKISMLDDDLKGILSNIQDYIRVGNEMRQRTNKVLQSTNKTLKRVLQVMKDNSQVRKT